MLNWVNRVLLEYKRTDYFCLTGSVWSGNNVTEEKAGKQSLVEKGNDSSGKWNGSLYGLLEGGQGKAWGTLQAGRNEELSAGLKEETVEEI